MASVMANCIKRSNSILNYGQNCEYAESQVYASFFAGFVQMTNLIIFATFLMSKTLSEILKKVVPKPGEGPSEKDMDEGFLKVTAHATGDKGGRVQAVIYFPTGEIYIVFIYLYTYVYLYIYSLYR
jgi:short subunit dehydrogenase-like uncharacterized protein